MRSTSTASGRRSRRVVDTAGRRRRSRGTCRPRRARGAPRRPAVPRRSAAAVPSESGRRGRRQPGGRTGRTVSPGDTTRSFGMTSSGSVRLRRRRGRGARRESRRGNLRVWPCARAAPRSRGSSRRRRVVAAVTASGTESPPRRQPSAAGTGQMLPGSILCGTGRTLGRTGRNRSRDCIGRNRSRAEPITVPRSFCSGSVPTLPVCLRLC